MLEQQLGYGATKKEAEVDAAKNLLPNIESKLANGIPLSPVCLYHLCLSGMLCLCLISISSHSV